MCEFCKNIEIGVPNWNFLPEEDSDIVPGGMKIEIRKIIDYNALVFTNSADEYGAGALNINYCPICGRKMVEE